MDRRQSIATTFGANVLMHPDGELVAIAASPPAARRPALLADLQPLVAWANQRQLGLVIAGADASSRDGWLLLWLDCRGPSDRHGLVERVIQVLRRHAVRPLGCVLDQDLMLEAVASLPGDER